MRPAPDQGDGLLATGLDLLLYHARIGAVSNNLEDASEAAQVPRTRTDRQPLAVLMQRTADHHARMPKATPLLSSCTMRHYRQCRFVCNDPFTRLNLFQDVIRQGLEWLVGTISKLGRFIRGARNLRPNVLSWYSHSCIDLAGSEQ